jgi:hypothetical protein
MRRIGNLNSDPLTLYRLVNYSSGFCEVPELISINGPAFRENLHIKLETVTLASRAELAEPSSLACQSNLAVAQIRPAVEQLGQFELYW